jgi:hypothetical protein
MTHTMTSIDRLELLTAHERNVLRSYSVTSAEDVVGLLESSPDDVAQLLGWSRAHINAVLGAARAALPVATRRLLRASRGRERPLGAVPPPGDAKGWGS